jgi:hypothetical protein
MSKDKVEAQVEETAPKHDEELIHAPKGRKKGQFILAFLIAVMVLTTFSVTGSVVDFFACSPGGADVAMTWKHPTEGTQIVKAGEFQQQFRLHGYVMEILTGNRGREAPEEELAEFLIFDKLAESSGIAVTDAEMSDRLGQLVQAFGGVDNYRRMLANYRMSPREFEGMLRRLLRKERYLGLVSSAVSSPDPTEIEKQWKQRHQEYAFEYVQLDTEKVLDEARAAAPSGAELEAWFNGLSEPERNKHRLQESARAEVVYKTIGPEMQAEALLARYPQTVDPETSARNYHEGFKYVRFPNPNFRPDPQNFNPEDFYLKFDEAKDQCLVEAPIYDAMMAWVADMNARVQKGENVDLLAEAQGFGMGIHNPQAPMTRTDWSRDGVPGWGRYIAEAIFDPSDKIDDIHPAVVVDKTSLAVVRIRERQEARMPAFAEIEAKVKEDWVQKKATDLAVAKLEALRDKLGTRPPADDPMAPLWRPEVDAETFARVATEAGFTVERRDFQERTTAFKPGETLTPIQTFLSQAAVFYTMKETSVPKAEPSRDGKTAFLVRVAGVRDPDVARMTPLDYQSLGSQAAQTGVFDLRTRLFTSKEYLVQQFGLHMPHWDREKTAGS